ncbi:MAG TPA: hypothetical protein VF133_02925 [Terriglobales bacterium]
MLVAVFVIFRFAVQGNIRQFDPALKAHSQFVAGAPVVRRFVLKQVFGSVGIGVATAALDERFLGGTVHSLIMTAPPL